MHVSTRAVTRFEGTKAGDLLCALPVIAWYCAAVVRDYPALSRSADAIASGHTDAATLVNLGARTAAFLLPVLLVAFVLLRGPPTLATS